MPTVITDPALVAFLRRLDAEAAAIRPKYEHLIREAEARRAAGIAAPLADEATQDKP